MTIAASMFCLLGSPAFVRFRASCSAPFKNQLSAIGCESVPNGGTPRKQSSPVSASLSAALSATQMPVSTSRLRHHIWPSGPAVTWVASGNASGEGGVSHCAPKWRFRMPHRELNRDFRVSAKVLASGMPDTPADALRLLYRGELSRYNSASSQACRFYVLLNTFNVVFFIFLIY